MSACRGPVELMESAGSSARTSNYRPKPLVHNGISETYVTILEPDSQPRPVEALPEGPGGRGGVGPQYLHGWPPARPRTI